MNLTPAAAAALLAAVLTAIESAGIQVRADAIRLVAGDDEATAACGWADGDPWVPLRPGQRVTPRGIEDT